MSGIQSGKWFVGMLAAGCFASAQAATISLNPLSQSVTLGEQVSLQLTMDFSSDPTLGGGINVIYDSRLSYVSFVFNAALGDDPAFRRLPDDLGGELNGLAFGHFSGLSGPSAVGVLTFDTIAPGAATLNMTDNITPAGGFYSAVTFGPQAVSYLGASLSVSAVPLPAAVWLMLSGLGSIGFVVGKKRRLA